MHTWCAQGLPIVKKTESLRNASHCIASSFSALPHPLSLHHPLRSLTPAPPDPKLRSFCSQIGNWNANSKS